MYYSPRKLESVERKWIRHAELESLLAATLMSTQRLDTTIRVQRLPVWPIDKIEGVCPIALRCCTNFSMPTIIFELSCISPKELIATKYRRKEKHFMWLIS